MTAISEYDQYLLFIIYRKVAEKTGRFDNEIRKARTEIKHAKTAAGSLCQPRMAAR